MHYKQFLFVIVIINKLINCRSELIGVVEIFRHGARTPLAFKESCAKLFFGSRKAQLTIDGFRQHILLGRWLRRRYVKGEIGKLFSNEKMPEEIKIYTSPRQRTIFSATAQIMGLFPNSYTKTIYQSGDFKNNDVPPIKNFLIEKQFGREYLINVLDYEHAHIFSCMSCNYKNSKKNVKSMINREIIFPISAQQISDASIDILEKYDFIFKNKKNFNNEKDHENFQKYYNQKQFSKKLINFIVPYKHSFNFHNHLNHENHTIVKKFILDKWFGIRLNDSKELKMSMSALFEKIIEFFKNRIENKNKEKMLIFSGHDNNIVDFFCNIIDSKFLLIKIKKAYESVDDYNFLIPRLASSILLELYKEENEYYINILYNGQNYNNLIFKLPMRVNKINNKIFFEDFKNLLLNRIDNDYKKLECGKS